MLTFTLELPPLLFGPAISMQPCGCLNVVTEENYVCGFVPFCFLHSCFIWFFKWRSTASPPSHPSSEPLPICMQGSCSLRYWTSNAGKSSFSSLHLIKHGETLSSLMLRSVCFLLFLIFIVCIHCTWHHCQIYQLLIRVLIRDFVPEEVAGLMFMLDQQQCNLPLQRFECFKMETTSKKD